MHVIVGFRPVSRALSLLGRMSSPQVCLESPVPSFQSIKKRDAYGIYTTQRWLRTATPVSTFVLE